MLFGSAGPFALSKKLATARMGGKAGIGAPKSGAGFPSGIGAQKASPEVKKGFPFGNDKSKEGARLIDEKGLKTKPPTPKPSSPGAGSKDEARQKEIQGCVEKHKQRFVSKSESSKLFQKVQAESDKPLSKQEIFTLAAAHRINGLPIDKNSIKACVKQLSLKRPV